MRFTKMNGLGNDYVYVYTETENVLDPCNLAIKVSDRHFGVGSDGLVLISKSKIADFTMRMFNPDGSESGICGNALRCVGKYVFESGLTKKNALLIETLSGIKYVNLSIKDNKVNIISVCMGTPLAPDYMMPYKVIAADKVFFGYRIDVGNPHYVIFVDEFWDRMMYYGQIISNNTAYFCQRTNVEFAIVKDRTHMEMRVYERGTGETLACGSGATALFYAAEKLNKVDREVVISLLGGELRCEMNNNEVIVSGTAEKNFDGIIEDE